MQVCAGTEANAPSTAGRAPHGRQAGPVEEGRQGPAPPTWAAEGSPMRKFQAEPEKEWRSGCVKEGAGTFQAGAPQPDQGSGVTWCTSTRGAEMTRRGGGGGDGEGGGGAHNHAHPWSDGFARVPPQ